LGCVAASTLFVGDFAHEQELTLCTHGVHSSTACLAHHRIEKGEAYRVAAYRLHKSPCVSPLGSDVTTVVSRPPSVRLASIAPGIRAAFSVLKESLKGLNVRLYTYK